jgi:isoaspartyl peptidase/L-asparaginase-like protein (Ntn-hydrolase superfamily)
VARAVEDDGAEQAAERHGFPAVPDAELRAPGRPRAADPAPALAESDTVGAVVLDRAGHLAAATSTGGIARKLPGRVGDSPLPGAGVYARDGVCAVSATGTGERLVEAVAAHEVAARVRHAGEPLERAVAGALADVVGDAGLIALDARGAAAHAANTPTFLRALARGDEPVRAWVRT